MLLKKDMSKTGGVRVKTAACWEEVFVVMVLAHEQIENIMDKQIGGGGGRSGWVVGAKFWKLGHNTRSLYLNIVVV